MLDRQGSSSVAIMIAFAGVRDTRYVLGSAMRQRNRIALRDLMRCRQVHTSAVKSKAGAEVVRLKI